MRVVVVLALLTCFAASSKLPNYQKVCGLPKCLGCVAVAAMRVMNSPTFTVGQCGSECGVGNVCNGGVVGKVR